MFQTTYIGHHTCIDIVKTPQIVTETRGWECLLAKSESAIAVTPTIKQEAKEEALSDLSDNLPPLWLDLKDFPLSGPMGSDNGDVVSTMYSCTETASLSLDIDFDGDFSDFL
jgi:hypothetical protein